MSGDAWMDQEERQPTRATDRWITDAELDPELDSDAYLSVRAWRERALEEGIAPEGPAPG